MTRILILSPLLLSLAACGGGEPSGKTSTKLDAVEVEPGTISDSMIILDNASGDGTAIDNSVPNDGSKKDAAKSDEDEGDGADAPADVEADTADDAEKMPAPAAKQAKTDSE